MLKNKSNSITANSGFEIQTIRPEPITSDIDALFYERHMAPQIAVNALVDGHFVLINDFYSSGLTVLNELKRYVKSKYSDQSFKGQRDFRSVFHELSNRLLLFVRNNKLDVRKAPQIGWFKKLYPELDEFLLPFPQVQGLNSAWQWYEKGIAIPVIHTKIHPFFGTYFPTRFEHLNLFETWLKQYKGEKRSAFDIGIGCGVLSFQMLKYGFEKIYGTDTNPNAIIGLNEGLEKNKQYQKIELVLGDLFANFTAKTELIVFNPPWLPASHNIDGIDNAIYYDDNLFPRFFAEAKKHLKPNGSVVLLFSNLAQVTKVTDSHPIETELSSSGRFKKNLFIQKKVGQASGNTKRNQTWRASEMVELWVLKEGNSG